MWSFERPIESELMSRQRVWWNWSDREWDAEGRGVDGYWRNARRSDISVMSSHALVNYFSLSCDVEFEVWLDVKYDCSSRHFLVELPGCAPCKPVYVPDEHTSYVDRSTNRRVSYYRLESGDERSASWQIENTIRDSRTRCWDIGPLLPAELTNFLTNYGDL